MARRQVRQAGPTPVEALRHDEKRVNIPTADARDFLDAEGSRSARLRYPRDTSLDPQLVWSGKDEQDGEDLAVEAPPIYIQEKIDPRVLVENLRRTAARPQDEPELALFESFDGLEGWETVDFYKHSANWSNRMILGDSLQVMGSLAEKESLRGQVQMIYIDPPYGIRFGSNWQVSTRKRVVEGKVEDATREVEQIKAFRDTWEKGIHSYLAYLRDRLVVARDLLTESGSVFVQISDENVHRVRCVLDEVFGDTNQVATIAIAKASPETTIIRNSFNYLLWYAREAPRVKAAKVFRRRDPREGSTEDPAKLALWVRVPNGAERAMTRDEKREPSLLPHGSQIFRMDKIVDQGVTGRRFGLSVGESEVWPKAGFSWRGDDVEMGRLLLADRVGKTPDGLGYKFFLDDYPLVEWGTYWHDTAGKVVDMSYVVQTNAKVIERCLLMTTDPGDLVLDPTCGSGTTAYVAEQWGRRWITIDTSRVAIALARQRLMGAKLPYYLLADSPDGRTKEADLSGQAQPTTPTSNDVRKGFVYERVPHVTLKSIANNPDIREGMSREEIDAAIARHADTELLYDRPYEDRRKVRVAGPFTVESLSPHRVVSEDADQPATEQAAAEQDTDAFVRMVLDNLAKAGVQNGRRKERLEFETLTPFAGRLIQAEGMQKGGNGDAPQRIAVSVGPQYGTVSSEWIKDAAREALRGQGFDALCVLGFAFDPQAVEMEEFRPNGAGDFAAVQAERRLGRLPVLIVRMNADLAMGDAVLKKTGSANLFTVFGEPDVAIEETPDGLVVEIRGVDVYNPTTGEIRSDGTDEIALWMVDTAYNEESFFVRHCYFAGTDGKPDGLDPYARLKRAFKADIDEAAWATMYGTRSRPFAKPDTGKIAVKVVNHYGDEVLKVYQV